MHFFQDPHHKTVGLMLAASVLWSTGGILIKLIPWNAAFISGMRSLIAGIALFVFIRISGRKIRFNRYSVSTAVFMTGMMFAFVVSNKLTTAANAIVLEYTSPILILVFSAVFLKQKFMRQDITAVAAVFLGISLSFFDHISPGNLAGNCVALLSGVFCAAMYVICGEADMESRVSGIFLSQLLTAAIGIPFAAFDPPKVTLTAVLSLIALGVFQIGISYIFYAMALRDCPPLACSLIGAAEPLLNPLWVFVFNGEAPGVFPLVGGGVVILSVTGWCVWRDRFLAAQQ
ncbi:DMT family transporter [Thermocaproicibacter melissae]|uniref:DMT family transporter n=1 Tax=Thermocaproicibacter melissae TaxID=2966552 RepID=UPI0024B177F6|nr:DMT family transporter [Thermocaproicibacter melissae]WBY63889.1 DMT family transporter [Thermocaproicibacter melissae]